MYIFLEVTEQINTKIYTPRVDKNDFAALVMWKHVNNNRDACNDDDMDTTCVIARQHHVELVCNEVIINR